MALISIAETINIVIATLVVGYIFTGLFNLRLSRKDVLDVYTKGFDWNEFWFACLVAAPGVVLHEMAHKFVALAFGLSAVFKLSYFGLILGVMLKFFSAGFIVLAPGYVQIFGGNNLQVILTAFSGPFMNFLLFFTAFLTVKYKMNMTRREAIFWNLTKNINKWLFIFNILPIPPLDGFKFWYGLFQLLF